MKLTINYLEEDLTTELLHKIEQAIKSLKEKR